MRRPRTQPAPVAQPPANQAPSAPSAWRDLAWYPADENRLARRHLQLWQWQLAPLAYVLLKPALTPAGTSTRRAIVAETLKGTEPVQRSQYIRDDDPMQFGDEVPVTTMRVWWVDHAGGFASCYSEVPNALVLRYVSLGYTPSPRAFLALPLSDETWDYTCEHPDHPGVRQPGPPCLFKDMPVPEKHQPRALDLSFMDD